MYISYSAYKTFLDCRRQYDHKYVLKTKVPKAENRVHMLYGDAVGKIFETFYEDHLWQGDTLNRLLALVDPTLNRIIESETRKGGVFNWKDRSLKDDTRSLAVVRHEVILAIPRGLRSIRKHRLLGPEARAEVNLDVETGGHKIGGRCDFLIRRVKPQGDLVLIDGKGSRWRDKYTNHRQLRWYAMQHWMKFGVVPDQLGFLYWRFEPEAPKPDERSMDWSTVTVPELVDLKTEVLSVCDEIEKAKLELIKLGPKANRATVFWPKPSSDCRLCNYLTLCPEGERGLSKETKTAIEQSCEDGVEEGGISF